MNLEVSKFYDDIIVGKAETLFVCGLVEVEGKGSELILEDKIA